MPLTLSSPPPNTYNLVAQALSRLSLAGGAAEAVTRFDDPSKLNVALAHKVYTLGSNQIVRGQSLNKARLVSWRLLIQHGLKTIAAMELSCDPLGNNLRFASLDTGPFALATRNVVEQAERSDAVKLGSYELRVLKAPSVYVMAVWLKNLEGGDDIVLPIDPAQPVGAVGGATLHQSPSAFIKELRSAAATSIEFYNTPPSQGGLRPPTDQGGNAPEGRSHRLSRSPPKRK